MPTPIFGPVVACATWPLSAVPLAEAAIYARPELREALAHNQDISAETWFALYTTKPLPKVKTAIALVKRPLSEAQVAWVASVETRSSVLELVMAAHPLPVEAQARLASGKGLTQATAKLLCVAAWADPAAKEAACRKAGDVALLRWLANATVSECPVESAAELVRTWKSWAGPKLYEPALMRRLVENRPDLHEAILTQGPDHALFGPVVLSRRLSDPALIKLAIGQLKGAGKVADRAFDMAQDMDGVGMYGQHTLRDRAKQAGKRLNGYERHLMTLIANPAVSPDLVTAAYRVGKNISRRSGAPLVEEAYQRRTGPGYGAYHPMSGAITLPYDQISDPAVLDYLVERLCNWNEGFDLAEMARNPHLGKRAKVLAVQLMKGWSWAVTRQDARTAVEAFRVNYPELAGEVYWTEPTAHVVNYVRPRFGATYIKGNFGTPGGSSGGWPNQTDVMPEHYPVPLAQVERMPMPVLSGVAQYVAKRLGDNATAWVTFFGLADELAASDLDTLCDTACALGA